MSANDHRTTSINPPRPVSLVTQGHHQPSRILNKYLSQYAEPEARNLPVTDIDHYDYCLTVPVFDETVETLRNVWTNLDRQTHFLLVLVINSSLPDQTWALTLSAKLQRSGTVQRITEQHTMVRGRHSTSDSENDTEDKVPYQPDILIIDRYSPGRTIDRKQGVGRARKIAADVAARLIAEGAIKSPWIFATDADAILPTDYFDITPAPMDTAITYPFRHQAKPDLQNAADLYELTMLYYVAGLKYAGSPFAFPTIGSTMASHIEAYAAVRGYPPRPTGEDFYLLNKLRKIGTVGTLDHPPIILEGRESKRVPIGTGRAITTIRQHGQPADEVRVEHPDCFEALRQFLAMLRQVATSGQSPAAFGDEELAAYAESTGLTASIEQAKVQNPDPAFMTQHIRNQFDGLRTRQFVHYFRDNHKGSIPIRQISLAAFVTEDDIAAQRKQLMRAIVRQIHD